MTNTSELSSMQSEIELILNILRNKKILILGFGREGQSTLRFLNHWLPGAEIGLADANLISETILPENHSYTLHTGPDYLQAVDKYQFIIKTPGIPGRLIQLKSDQILSSQTDLFLEAFHKQVIGISGTKGKSTCSSLIHHVLQESGFKSILTGNIGIPCFDIIPQINPTSWVVFELSANQLEMSKHSPRIAVLLNIYEEHLDHFGTYDAYIRAKLQLIRYSSIGDTVILHKSLRQYYSGNAFLHLFPDPAQLQNAHALKLRGEHNQWNAQAAVLAAKATGVDEDTMIKALSSFAGLPHRLEFVGKKNGISFYNDSIATIPEACIAALKTFEKVDYLIVGGFDRGIHYEILADYLLQHPVKHLFLIGKAGQRIGSLFQKNNHEPIIIHLVENLNDVFEIVRQCGQSGEICLLSPAASSYDQYKNFEHRGEVFKALVAEFGNA